MPSINRIRVNNVKYNFGTQYYDDFTMRMYGRNTLYDLANGGGKSVLMLLLLQNLIPNCTLDDKQPVEKLFREGCGNTAIHSLIEWKLDPCDVKEGYRYMTTGFCARKARETEESGSASGVASIEYFNYCIFYRNYNRNDIVNLPLVRDGERISYQALRNYLKDLEHRDIELVVKVFDKKGEYQRFISGYGLHESQWEIVRGINKTEGHVRTYFETNYKTTRKVVEDLLIEEIIEKAFLVKTERDADGNESMARLLMDIKDQLAVLAGKKKDIAAYDHQSSLIQLLADKVNSFMDIYREQDTLVRRLADICVTGEEFAKNDASVMEELKQKRDEKAAMKHRQQQRLENLKVAKAKKDAEALQEELNQLAESEDKLKKSLEQLRQDVIFKECINEYMDYLEEVKKLESLQAAEQLELQEGQDDGYFRRVAANLKQRYDEKQEALRRKLEVLSGRLYEVRTQKETQEKLLSETEIQLAVTENNHRIARENIEKLSRRLAELTKELHSYSFENIDVQRQENEAERGRLGQLLAEKTEELEAVNSAMTEAEQSSQALEAQLERLKAEELSLAEMAEYFKKYKSKLDNILRIYGKGEHEDYGALREIIQSRIFTDLVAVEEKKKELAQAKKSAERLKEKRVVAISQGAGKLIDYIQSRHGSYAMYGMDYLSALPEEQKKQLLEVNPELPYGVLVRDFRKLSEDQNIREVDTGCEAIVIYDLEQLESQAVEYNRNAFSVYKSADYFVDGERQQELLLAQEKKRAELEEELKGLADRLAVEQEDLTFILTYADEKYTGAEAKSKAIRLAIANTGEDARKQESLQQELAAKQETLEQVLTENRRKQKELEEDDARLLRMQELSELLEEQEQLLAQSKREQKRLQEKQRELADTERTGAVRLEEETGKLRYAERELEKLESDWEQKYSAYYVPGAYEPLSDSDEVLESKFKALIQDNREMVRATEDRRLLMETLQNGIKRLRDSIEKQGVSLERLEKLKAKGELYPISREILESQRKNISALEQEREALSREGKKKQAEYSRLEGKIEYAIKNIEAAYGSYQEETAALSEILTALQDGEALLRKLTEEAAACETACVSYQKEQGYMLDLYKDVKRIVERNQISLSEATPIREEKETLREIFEDVLVRFDKASKLLERAKNELLRFKGTTAQTLSEMGAFEMAATIRDDVQIPADYSETRALLENLNSITGYIKLEKDRIEKSLSDMERLKSNFEEQCLQRCMDVKTELDKLPKLSGIVLDGEHIQMVGLTIPYVKEEFMHQRMSDYIEKIVSGADAIKEDKDRMKYIQNCLALKKLFGVIVTDMNSIRLNLYKRERIREQSRYLRYEEAVGSTGQSQGIYIQFLVSIINYISGMYAVSKDEERSKTIFIDNPFGAAKDVYIWEPIFALLAANHVQLIVPARGATPAITGRFDVNYVLGQQMVGSKQVTVVVNYTSKTNQEELEYHELEFEQATFDFI